MAVFRKAEDGDYFVTSRKWAQDKRIKNSTRGLLAFMLSQPANWEFNMQWLESHLRDGEEALRNQIKEAVKYGYIKRFPQKRQVDGKFSNDSLWLVYDQAQITEPFSDEFISKIFSHKGMHSNELESIYEEASINKLEKPKPGNPGPANPAPAKSGVREDKEGIEVQKEKKSRSPAAPVAPAARPIAELLLKTIRSWHPEYKEPKLDKWTDAIDKMLRIDGRKQEDIEAVLKWLPSEAFEHPNILCASSLRKKFDRLFVKCKATSSPKSPKLLSNRAKNWKVLIPLKELYKDNFKYYRLDIVNNLEVAFNTTSEKGARLDDCFETFCEDLCVAFNIKPHDLKSFLKSLQNAQKGA